MNSNFLPFRDFFKTNTRLKIGLSLLMIFSLVFVVVKQTNIQKNKYQFYSVRKGEVVSEFSETGKILSSNISQVISTKTGIVKKMYIGNGDSVRRGDSLFEVESIASEQEQSEAYSKYLKAKADLEFAQAEKYVLQAEMFTEWDSFKELAEKDEYDLEKHPENRALPEFHIPEKKWLAAEIEYKNQDQVLSQLKADINSTWLNYEALINGAVRSPASGKVANVTIDLGQQVSVKDNSPILMVVSDADTWVKISVSEIDIPRITVSKEAVVVVDAYPDKKYTAEVMRIDQVGTFQQGVVTYDVYLRLKDPDSNLLPVMTVNVTIQLDAKDNVLIVPNSAIVTFQGDRAVRIIDQKSKQPLYLPIETGLIGLTHTEIVRGITEGQEIIIGSDVKAVQK